MFEADAQPGASSAPADTTPIPATAAEQAVMSDDVAAFKQARRAERSGKPLDAKPADSSSAQPAEQDTSTEVKPEGVSETPKPRKTAEDRVKELLAERAKERERAEALERRLAALEGRTQPDAKPAESSPATATDKFPDYDTYLQEHPDASYEDYIDARADWRADQRLLAKERETSEREKREYATRTVQERRQKAAEAFEQARKADPALAERLEHLHPDVAALRSLDDIRGADGKWIEQPTPYHWITQQIVQAGPVAPHLAAHFSDHPEELHEIAKLNPDDALERIVALKLQFRGKRAASPTPSKPVTDAPPPPTTLATRGGAPSMPDSDAAVAAGDVAAYRAARLREKTAAMR